MKIESLAIRNFRNLSDVNILPGEGVNIFYGDNAQGKTNLVEAVYLLTGQRSFRQSKESDFIRFGEAKAEIVCGFYQGGRSQTATLTYNKGGKAPPGTRDGGQSGKAALINDIPSQPSELTGLFCAVVFSPTEISMVKEGPALRRAFLDSAISQVMPRYMRNMAAFGRVLAQRNSLLFDLVRHPGLEDQLQVWDRSFAKAAYSVINARSRYIARLAPKAEEVYHEISGGREALDARYQPTIEGPWGTAGPKEGEAAILAALEEARGEDIKNGFTTLGPHRDDLLLTLDGVPARTFGSQGQQRSCALALKLGECAVIEEVSGESPVILLDDVLSELDKQRRDYFLSGPGARRGQLFITCCDRTGFRSVTRGVTMRIKDGAVKSRREIG